MTDVVKAMKSTVDYYGEQIANAYLAGVDRVDLTSVVNLEELLSSDNAVVIWEMGVMREAPRAPLWDVQFAIGAKTVKDQGNFVQMDMLEAVNNVIEVGADLDVRDYSGDIAPVIGKLHITRVELDQHQTDRMAGVRMFVVSGKFFSLTL